MKVFRGGDKRGITNSNKEISLEQIECGGDFQVRLSLTAEPSIMENPTDIVLLLDRSGSMAGSALANLKNGAKKFMEIIDESTDGSEDGQIGGGSHIGIVSFADVATQDTQLITSMAALGAAMDALSAGGSTNHADAFTKGLQLFDPTSTNAKVMIMFTDGVTTAGGNPNTVATLAKAQGVIIYSIGLSGNGGIDEQALRDWASGPDSAYVVITPEIEVGCDIVVIPEGCPMPVNIVIDGCGDTIEYDAGAISLDSLGAILQLDVTIQDVCPGKRVALAVILTEVDENDEEHKRGLKTLTIPAHTRDTCSDVTVRCIKFVLPEDLNVSGSMCSGRSLRAKFIAHYIDNDFECCSLV